MSALEDLRSGKDFYDRQGSGLGDYFQECLFSDIDLLNQYGGIHRRVFGFHRLLSKKFPYAIYYRMESDHSVLVYRVLDCRRDPGRLKKSLGY